MFYPLLQGVTTSGDGIPDLQLDLPDFFLCLLYFFPSSLFSVCLNFCGFHIWKWWRILCLCNALWLVQLYRGEPASWGTPGAHLHWTSNGGTDRAAGPTLLPHKGPPRETPGSCHRDCRLHEQESKEINSCYWHMFCCDLVGRNSQFCSTHKKIIMEVIFRRNTIIFCCNWQVYLWVL